MLPKNEPHKVMQTKDDNCYAACLASYFRMPIEDVPDPKSDDHWRLPIKKWAALMGLGYVTIEVPNQRVFKQEFSKGYLIVAGESIRGVLHGVIYKDGKLWHDPHPSGAGIKKVIQVDFFYPLCPL